MIPQSNCFRYLVATLVMILFGTIPLHADVPFSVSIEKPDRTLDAMAFTTFEVHVTNTTGESIRVRAIRTKNDLPSAEWYSSICSMNTCYPPEVDTTEFESAPAGAMTGFTIHVMTGARYGDTARITIQIDTGAGSEAVVREVTIATAQPPARLFRVEPRELEQSVVVGGTAEFWMLIANQAGDTLSVGTVRVEDYYTSKGWESSLCLEDDCYDASTAATPVRLLETDKATFVRLRVRAGAPGQGRVVLRFNTLRGTEPIEHRFTVNAGPATVAQEDVRLTPAYPNPARSTIHLPLPADHVPGRTVSVQLFRSSDGATVGDQRHTAPIASTGLSIKLDVSALSSGSYLYRIMSGEMSTVGQFQITR